MLISRIFIGASLIALAAPGVSRAVELRRETLASWDEYVQRADQRMQDRLGAQAPFLWTDESSDRRARLQRGEVVVAPVVGHGTRSVPDGLIHDWIGAVFIPGAHIEDLWSVVHDYNNYKRIYQPAVTESKSLACTVEDQKFSMIWQRHVLFVNAAIEGEYHAHDFVVDGHRGYNIADTIRVQEIENYGRPGEHLLPPGTGNGFIWRLHSIARYEEREGGVYLELEAIALTRDIPASLRWMANPVVNHLSVNSLTATLRETRQAVRALPPNRDQLAVCNDRSRAIASLR